MVSQFVEAEICQKYELESSRLYSTRVNSVEWNLGSLIGMRISRVSMSNPTVSHGTHSHIDWT